MTKVIDYNKIKELDSEEYKNEVNNVLVKLLTNDDLIHNVIVSLDETEYFDYDLVSIQFCLTSNSPPYFLTDYGLYLSMYHKEKSFVEKYIWQEQEYYRFTFVFTSTITT